LVGCAFPGVRRRPTHPRLLALQAYGLRAGGGRGAGDGAAGGLWWWVFGSGGGCWSVATLGVGHLGSESPSVMRRVRIWVVSRCLE